MTGHKIEIKKLRGIDNLVFEFPNTGVHVLSAANGCGKTTLLVCIERIVNTRAFNENFKKHAARNVDSYDESRIIYKNNNGTEVSYKYRRTSDSWKAMSKSKNVLDDIYTSVQYMPTLGKRVYVQKGVIGRGSLRPANPIFKAAMTEVLEDDRFAHLLQYKVGETRGRKGSNRRENTAYFLPLGRKQVAGNRQNYFYAESSFSLGEIFVLNLLYRIQNISEGSLLLVDELEVALHPRVQFKLLRYLERIALERKLTVIVSTHSSSLIKCAKNLIFLEKDNLGKVKLHYNCYPTYALREVAIMEDISPDYVFYVEDTMAEILLRLFIERYFREYSDKVVPLWKVLPIGGYVQVLSFGQRSRDYLLPKFIGQYLFLDQDVIAEKTKLKCQANKRTKKEQKLWELFQEMEARTRYLDITPELGLWNWMVNNVITIQAKINSNYTDRSIDFSRIIHDCNANFPTPSDNPRNEAKNKINWLANELGIQLGLDKEKTVQELFTIYTIVLFSNQAEIGKLKALFGPIFNHRGNH